MSAAPSPERIQKVLAQAGIGSRREIEGWIADGRISINGKRVKLGDKMAPGDKVRLDGELLRLEPAPTQKTRILAYHKPVGEVSTRKDEKGRPTVFDSLPGIKGSRWISIGRLDINTSGLLLFTNDGSLAHQLMHPSGEVEREYAVRVLGEVSRDTLKKLVDGVELEDGKAHFDSIHEAGGKGANHWYHVVIKEGRNREIRRIWEAVNVTVSRLMRVRFGPYSLPRDLKAGSYHELSRIEVNQFIDAVKRDS